MLRKGLVDEVTQHGDDRKAMVVDLGGGAYVDIESVRYDANANCIVLVADKNDLVGALDELKTKCAGIR